MLATVGGTLALLLGLLLLLLPLLANELSRPRDSVWGAVVLLLGLVLVTSADRLTGAPMLAVLCGGLLIGRLSSEVGQARWRQLSDEERQLLASSERWSRSAQQLTATCGNLLSQASGSLSGLFSGLGARLSSRPQRPVSSKRWVRPESPETAAGKNSQDGREPQAPASLAEEPSRPSAPTPPAQQPAAEDSPRQPEPSAQAQAADETTGADPMPATPASPDPGSQEPEKTSTSAASPEVSVPANDGSRPEVPPVTPRPVTPEDSAAPASTGGSAAPDPAADVQGEPRTQMVRDFAEISALLAAAPAPEGESSEAG